MLHPKIGYPVYDGINLYLYVYVYSLHMFTFFRVD